MELVSAIVGPVVNLLTVHITQKLSYLTSSTEHVKRMKNRMQFLEGQSADIEEHMKENNVNNRKIPARVPGWLEDVKKIKEEVDKISSTDIGCFNVKKKYLAGRNALRLLQDDDKTRVIALCGMGGVGKTTLMKQLKEAAHDNKMFNWIVVVVIGNTPNLLAIQKAIAVQTGEALTETDETLMATCLSKRFEVFSDRKERSLEEEARDFFCQIAGISAEHDRDLYRIGCDIVKKCGCLPLAIKIIAANVKYEKKRSVWKHTLKCSKKNNDVLEIVDMSYKNLEREEDKAIFLLCGLFPEDSNIPIEDLTRYAWGLKLLEQVSTMEDARESTETSVSNLKNKYLLMDGDSDDNECVKLHDLVLAFVVSTVSKGGGDGCWIIHHDDFSKWSEDVTMSQSCKRISLACNEVLSFANSGITILPSTFENLKKLRLLDVTGCYNLAIDNGVLKSLVKLEELYMIPYDKKACSFTDNNCSELVECSKNLSALEFEFIGNNAHMKNMSYEKLKRFKLSVGCYFSEVRDKLHTSKVVTHSYLNSLKLNTNKEELFKSKISELFKNTDALYLKVNGMNTLEDVDVESPLPAPGIEDASPKLEKLFVSDMENLKEIWPPQFSISNLCLLKELTVEGCGSIVVLFSMDFGEIEHLTSSLRSIKLKRCDCLVKLFTCNPFPFLNNLQELNVESCGSIQVLFNADLGRAGKSEEQVCSSRLRSIGVWGCDSLMNLLPSNPMPLFNHLEELEVRMCASIKVIFDIDMGCVGELDKVSSRLRSISLGELGKLREVWKIKDAGNNLSHGFEAVESIFVQDCERFDKLITPATTNIDMRALTEVSIIRCGGESERNIELAESNRDQEV
ncbi:NB-ARC domains-containing protein [Artemisia annua]|uniref:NB-ARC domains-containing protein n=1 Tax=Artemisia annua TaxID=35608 RepID=A0A2U1NS68_ARTAN|nr:NB-ARC domains-containing protein [Artemisia annua]